MSLADAKTTIGKGSWLAFLRRAGFAASGTSQVGKRTGQAHVQRALADAGKLLSPMFATRSADMLRCLPPALPLAEAFLLWWLAHGCSPFFCSYGAIGCLETMTWAGRSSRSTACSPSPVRKR